MKVLSSHKAFTEYPTFLSFDNFENRENVAVPRLLENMNCYMISANMTGNV